MSSLRMSWVLIAAITTSRSTGALGESEPLAESWSFYDYSEGPPPGYAHAWQSFSGLADSDGNLYWELWAMAGRVTPEISCQLRSTDRDGNERFQIFLFSGVHDVTVLRHLVAGSIIVTNWNARVTARSTSHGSVLWERNFSDEFPGEHYPGLGGLAHDGEGTIVALVGSAIVAMAVADGETIWRRDLGSEKPEMLVRLESPVLDEQGNVFFAKRACAGSPEQCRWSLVSFTRDGKGRFETETEPEAGVMPAAAANGRVLLSVGALSVFDAETGAAIVTLPRTVANVVLSDGLGFFVQAPLGMPERALVAFELTTGKEQWRMSLLGSGSDYEHTLLLTDAGNLLVSEKQTTQVWPVLEISPQGQLVRTIRLRPPDRPKEFPPCDIPPAPAQLVRGRWFAQACYTVVAYDLPGAPGEGFGWSSPYGNAQHQRRARTK